MKSLRRLTASIVASFEGVVGQLENHEALVTAAIREAEQAASRARAQLARVQRDGAGLRKRVEELREQAALWEERAKKSSAIDKDRALECVRRRQRATIQAEKLEEQANNHIKLERQLIVDLRTVDDKLLALRQQRNIMRTRESRAEALKLIHSADSSFIGELDDIFDRWEARIVTCEDQSRGVVVDDMDGLTEEFESQEERDKLLAILLSLQGDVSNQSHSK
jgi:phage shock protein A